MTATELAEATTTLLNARLRLKGGQKKWDALKEKYADPFFDAPTEVHALQVEYNDALRAVSQAEQVFVGDGLAVPAVRP